MIDFAHYIRLGTFDPGLTRVAFVCTEKDLYRLSVLFSQCLPFGNSQRKCFFYVFILFKCLSMHQSIVRSINQSIHYLLM